MTKREPNMRHVLPALFAITLALPVHAEQTVHQFSLYVSGIKAGNIRTDIRLNGSAFSVSGVLNPSSLLRTIRDVGYAGQSAGTHRNGTYSPRRYSAQTKTGSRNSQVKMRITDGIPSVDAYLPEREKRPHDITPADQKGVIDPLTAAATVFSDKTSKTLCNQMIDMFDGRRLSKLTLAPATIMGNSATCKGTYSRVAGFSPDDMQERVNFPFSLLYTRTDADTFRLMSFTTQTTFGSLRAKRK